MSLTDSLTSIGATVAGAFAEEAVRAVVGLLDDDMPDEATQELTELVRRVAMAPPDQRLGLLRKAVLMLASEKISDASMDAALKAAKKLQP